MSSDCNIQATYCSLCLNAGQLGLENSP